MPLIYYHIYFFYTMRTDALDRFGTTLEKRFTKLQITELMNQADLTTIVFLIHVHFGVRFSIVKFNICVA